MNLKLLPKIPLNTTIDLKNKKASLKSEVRVIIAFKNIF